MRHIERTSLLLFVLDASGWEGRDPVQDFTILRQELTSYNAELLEKPFMVALNKIDVEGADEWVRAFRSSYPFDPATLFEISALSSTGLNPLLNALEHVHKKN